MATNNLKTAMSCQWCNRKQQANKGVIAHHGYTVKGGYFSGTCNGSRELPFEADRTVKADLINALESLRTSWINDRKEIANETKGISYPKLTSRDRKEMQIITRENFNTISRRDLYAGHNSFNDIKSAELNKRDRQIKLISDDIKREEKLYCEWQQTHKFTGSEWVAI